MPIHLIAAIDINSGLGYKNQLLCKLPNDMKHFKTLTLGNIVCMGRKTYESIGKCLPERTNIILTRDYNYDVPEAYVYHSIKDIIHEYKNYGEEQTDVFIIGGSDTYKQFIPYSDYIHLTIIHNKFSNVDTFFPKFNVKDYTIISHIDNKADDKNEFDHSFVTYKHK